VTCGAARHGVQASVEGVTVTLYGRPDAVGVWTRHGARVARTALILLTSRALGPGVATVQLGEQQYEVRLDTTLLGKTLPLPCWAAPVSTWGAVDAVVRAIQTLRQRGRLAGWRLRWWPEPLVTTQGLLWPELMLRRGAMSLGLLPLSAAQLTAETGVLGALAQRLSCMLLAPEEGLCDIPADLQVIPCDDGHLTTRLAECLERCGASDAHNALPEPLARSPSRLWPDVLTVPRRKSVSASHQRRTPSVTLSTSMASASARRHGSHTPVPSSTKRRPATGGGSN
jgi:hypothetical protein